MNNNHFSSLKAWQHAHTLVLLVYRITKVFPSDERFGLVSQMRRASVSVISNIAEGYSRGTFRDKLQFYNIAKGSLTEIESQFFVARDLGFVQQLDIQEFGERFLESSKTLTGLLKSTRSKI